MKKTNMTISIIGMNEARLNARKTWLIKPFSRVKQSDKIYNRRDKSWRKEI